MSNLDYGALLENNFLSELRTVSLFFVAGIALFNFTSSGKNFSIISLTLAIILLIAVDTDYFIERHRIKKLGFTPRILIDIIAFAIVAVILLLIWMLYSVWDTPQRSLSALAKEVEKEVEGANLELVKNIKEIEEKIVITNKKLVEAIKNINNPNYVSSDIPISSPAIFKTSKLTKDIINKGKDLAGLAIGEAGRNRETDINTAFLAAVPAII